MPKIIAIHGPMAVGKSTITSLLRKRVPDYAYVDRPYIKRGLQPLGKDLAKKISKDASFEIIKKIMVLKKNIIIEELGADQIINKLKTYIRKYDYTVFGFYLICSLQEAKLREKQRVKRSRPKLLATIHKEYCLPKEQECVINTEKYTAKQSCNMIIKHVSG